MDIEGAEYAVIEDILGSDIEIKQILVEFHDRFDSSNGKPSRESIKKLLANGYDILSISESGDEYSFIKKEMIKEKIKTPLEINDIPVALITYNRPAHTKKVLNELSKHHIQNLYIFSDAPKNGNDVEKVNATRKLFKGIDWTQPNIIYQETNQGLAKSIISAVDLVFEKYSTVIVLEDDCVPQKYFFEFMKKSLDKYENAENIYGISGYSIPLDTDVIIDYPFDNYFFPRIGSWGWATWKHKWNQRIDNLDLLYEKLINNKINLEQGGTDVPQMLTALRNGTLKDVWTISWLLTVYLKNGYYVYPTKSHIDNIGMDGTGVHCGTTKKFDTKISDSVPDRFSEEAFLDDAIVNNFRKYYDIPKNETENKKKLNNLKVVHLSSADYGGAGRAAYRLHRGLLEIDIDSKFLVIDKRSADNSVIQINPQYNAYGNNLYNFEEEYKRWFENLESYPERPNGLELFTDVKSNFDIKNSDLIINADIINLHWVAGMFDYKDMPEIFKDKKIVWTLHDMNPFTGGCHYNAGCNKFESKCEACPQLGSYEKQDLSKINFDIKEKSYEHLNPEIITPSNWLSKDSF